jgi:glycosyltransferase involved in cell wall biosynthesis
MSDPIWLLLDSSRPGGIETHVRVLAAALCAAGRPATVVFYADHGEHPLRRQLEADGTPWAVLAGSPAGLLSALRRERPVLVHTHGYKAGVLGRLAAGLAGVPCVHTFHSGEPGPGLVPLWTALDRWTSGLAGARIAVADSIAAKLPWPATVVPNFVRLGDPPSGSPGRAVVFLGRLSEEKGPDLFCAAARRSDPAIGFHVYGDGPMRAALEAEHGGRVAFHGFTSDLAAVWRQAGLLLMPSRHEGLPMAALEAMAHGVPVAAARVGELPSVVLPGATGWLFEPGDAAAAAAAVACWWAESPSSLQLMAAAAYRRVGERYGEEAGLARTLAVYARLRPSLLPPPLPPSPHAA